MDSFEDSKDNGISSLKIIAAHPLPDLRLTRINANQSPRKTTSTPVSPTIAEQFACYPYLCYSKIVIDGQIRKMMKQSSLKPIYSVPVYITDLCKQYYYVEQDGYNQLAKHIYTVLKQLDKTSLNHKLLSLIVRKYLKLGRDQSDYKAQIRFFCKELVRLKYIVPVNKRNTLYMFAMDKTILFS